MAKFDWTLECKEAFAQLKEYLTQPSFLSKPQLGEGLYLYLVVSGVAIIVVLIREEGGAQLPIYYVSHSMVLVEIRYPNLEKLALTLLVASQKLRPDFQAHLIVVFTSHPLK